MPEQDNIKPRPHPNKSARPAVRGIASAIAYAELSATSNYTFLTGGSHPEELVERAAALGYRAIGVTDTNTLAGIVRAHVAAKQVGIPLVVGCRLTLADGPRVLVYPTNRPAYARLSGLLTLGKRRAPKGECHLTLGDLAEHHRGLLAVVEPEDVLDGGAGRSVAALREVFGADRLSVAASVSMSGGDGARLEALAAFSARHGLPLAATNRVLYHDQGRRALQDVLTCIRLGRTIREAGHDLEPNAERHLKAPEEMARLFAAHPQAVRRSVEIAERAGAFSMDELRYEYPSEACPPGMAPREYLAHAAWEGARRRYPAGVPERTRGALEHELGLIAELGYEPYFLTCYDIVNFARSRGILCQGRGGAANSAVCYCLGVTEVDPATHSLLFERFISRERGEPPDIDIDFEHERREEVIQYLYRKYGRERAALTAEVISYRGRSAIREVGKAMGLAPDTIDTLAKNLDRWGEAASEERVREAGLNPDDPTLRLVIERARELVGFPRHLSQHVGGFVITRSPLSELVPIENAAMEDRTVIEWDKDDIDAMGMLKVDCLGLGMLTCIRKAFGEVEAWTGGALSIARVMGEHGEDPAVYEMIQRADTVGVFQIESRAQMSMLPRLKPRTFYDLVIEVAIVRPGPIQGKMVHPYLRRRSGGEAVTYPNAEIERVLGRTLGVPLFQEQAMQLAIVAGGFTPDEADQLRRAMAAWKRKGDLIYRFGRRLVDGMVARGYPAEFAARCFEQIKGFSEYGFPESHAASFAILVYVSSWLKCHHPAAFATALINSQPMGFYQPAQIVRDAREHGVEVRPIDANHSRWDCTLEGEGAPCIRLGMRLVKGLAREDAEVIAAAVQAHGPFVSVERLWRVSGVSVRGLRCLARADAFASMGLARQEALWAIRTLRDEAMPLFDAAGDAALEDEGRACLPGITAPVRTLHDYTFTGLSLREHPVSFVREELGARGVTPAGTLRDRSACPHGRWVRVGGVVLVRQRPSTASGVVFITLEDETGIANLVVWSDTYERFRRVIRLSTALLVHGRVEREGEVVHLHAQSFESMDALLPALPSASRDFH